MAIEEIKKQIRSEIENEFPDLSPEERAAMIESRLKILSNSTRPNLIKVDIGDHASDETKSDLFLVLSHYFSTPEPLLLPRDAYQNSSFL